MRSLWNVLAANLVLGALGFTVSCTCFCGERNPVIGSAPKRRPGDEMTGKEVWRFVVSGDSRNCGDVIMPAIAKGAKIDGAQFYWHLGDLRAIYDFDDDMVQANRLLPPDKKKPLTISAYEETAWDDFIQNQVVPFENIPFRLGIGNHETIAPMKSRCEFAKKFRTMLDTPELQEGKTPVPLPGKNAAEPATAAPECAQGCQECAYLNTTTYYHWIKGGVDFLNLDNASKEQFDQRQFDWFTHVIDNDAKNNDIQSVVVGMHEALPWSVSCGHSMNESPQGIRSGEQVYQKLVALQGKGKKVYVLASHSHYYMLDIYNTQHWRDRNAVLPGWIVGTAGAIRYALPAAADLTKSRADTYGYLLGRVFADGTIDLKFTELETSDIPDGVNDRYSKSWIRESCFAGNRQTEVKPEEAYCKEEPPAK
jgi:hypothetical protein